ncbi:DUF4276 family protein, partial [Xanthomonas oryzae pv. oryzicola]|uniref:DUF4276 family protein n=2 Tax=Xanthomonas oryzae TaxID=347 RepID=UPI002DE7402C|nr:DUF4276 family protein [Xanthomonas oryzae pv. oryzicola]
AYRPRRADSQRRFKHLGRHPNPRVSGKPAEILPTQIFREPQNLLGICRLSGKIQFCLVRIACTELETFYLADLAAVGMALQMSRLASHQNNRKFRSPDAIGNPSKELKLITGNRYQKVAGSREIGKYLQLDNARSASFRNLVTGVRRMETELLAIPV